MPDLGDNDDDDDDDAGGGPHGDESPPATTTLGACQSSAKSGLETRWQGSVTQPTFSGGNFSRIGQTTRQVEEGIKSLGPRRCHPASVTAIGATGGAAAVAAEPAKERAAAVAKGKGGKYGRTNNRNRRRSSPEDEISLDKDDCTAGLEGEINAHVKCYGCHLWGHIKSRCGSRRADDGRWKEPLDERRPCPAGVLRLASPR
jgi:hypothetical protein